MDTRCSDKDSHVNQVERWRSFVPSRTSIFLTLYLIASLIINGGLNPFFKRGFFCNDSSIYYPIRSDTVHFKVLLVICLLIPSVILRICDKKLTQLTSCSGNRYKYYQQIRKRRKNSDSSLGDTEDKDLLRKPESPNRRNILINSDPNDLILDDYECGEVSLFSRVPLENDYEEGNDEFQTIYVKRRTPSRSQNMSHVQIYLFGIITTAFLTGIGKMTCGRLRPHFMHRCKPQVDCSSPENLNRYIEDFKCADDVRPRDISYISTSWPSGHASMIFFSMIYLIAYSNNMISIINRFSRAERNINHLFIYIIYVLMMGLASFVALSRIMDFHHHTTDVFSGSVLGTICGLLWAKVSIPKINQPILTNLNGRNLV